MPYCVTVCATSRSENGNILPRANTGQVHTYTCPSTNTTTVAKCGNATQVTNYTNLNKPMAKHIARATCKLAVFPELSRWGHLKSDSVAVWGSVTEDKRAQGGQAHIWHTCTVN